MITLTPCEITVATAAPFACIPNNPTKIKSRIIFSVHAIITKIIGLLESPIPLYMDAITL